MQPNGDPPIPPHHAASDPSPSRTSATVRKILGWALFVIGVMVAFGGLIGGNGFGGRIGGLLMGLAIAIVGAMLIWHFTTWKAAGPVAAVALLLGGLITPAAPKDPAPASGLVGPATSIATVTSSATVTVTATSAAPPTPATTTTPAPTTTAAVRTTTVAPPPNPGVAETDTRTPVPAPKRTETTARTPDEPEVPQGRTFSNCNEAKAAGAAPMQRGEPGYRPSLDRDGDGIACDK